MYCYAELINHLKPVIKYFFLTKFLEIWVFAVNCTENGSIMAIILLFSWANE